MIRSIRLTLTLWYIGILAAILGVFSWVLYASMSANLAQDVNEVLAGQADRMAGSLEAFWKSEQAAAPVAEGSASGSSVGTIRKTVSEGWGAGLVARWANASEEASVNRPLRVLDENGQVIYASSRFTQLELPVTKAASARARRRERVYETLSLAKARVRLLTSPMVEEGRVVYLIQVAAVLQQAGVPLERLRLWLFWLIPPTLVVTSAVGWFLATRALQPVGQMITQVRRIGEGHLQERIEVSRTDEELERLAGTFNDMLQRLERSFHRLRQFSAAASHELRTPLTAMKGEIEVTLRKPRDSDEYRRVLSQHLEMLNEMTRLVEELLTLARSEAVEGILEWRSVELGALLRQAHDALRTFADSRKVRVEIEVPEALWIRGEQRLLERLVVNLLDNALKYTPAKGRVTLRAQRREDEVRLSVRDTGPGIAAEDLPKIFDRFFKPAISANGDRASGLGLGLCRWIVEVHQGHIEVDSSPHQGTTFIVRLPLSLPP